MGAKILIYKATNGSVLCKLKFGDKRDEYGGFSYHQGKKKYCKWISLCNRDIDGYSMNIAFGYLDTFLSLNKIDSKTIEIDQNSLDIFYGYEQWNSNGLYFANLTTNNINSWWGRDCPDLFRYSVNKDRHENWFGLNLICFSNKLVEAGCSEVYIDEDINKDEIERLTKGREDTLICKEMWRVLEAKQLSSGEISYLEEKVKEYESNIQKVIDENKFEIMKHIEDMINKSYGLDCGSLHIYTPNEAYNENKRLLKNAKQNGGRSQWLDIRMPYLSQSVTIMQCEFSKVKEIIKRTLSEELYCQTVLD